MKAAAANASNKYNNSKKHNRRAAVISSHIASQLQQPDTSGSRVLAMTQQDVDETDKMYNTHNHSLITALHEAKGGVFTLMRDGQPVVFVRDPAGVKQVLQSENFGKTWDSEAVSTSQVDYVMNLIQPMLKKTIFNFHGDENFKRRANLRPLLTSPETFKGLFEEVSREEINSWPNGVVDIQDLSHTLLRKNILVCLVGKWATEMYFTIPAFHSTMEYFVQRYAAACHDQTVTEDDNTHMQAIYDASLKAVHRFKQLMAERPGEVDDTVTKSMFGIYVSKDYSDYEMAATMVNVMIAAGEAPASALAQTLEELGRDQATQGEVLDEALSLAGPRGDLAPVADKLEFALNCTTEGLRLFAPATLVQRTALEATELCGMHVPKGRVVGVCVHSVHHDAKLWKEPEAFNPRRPGLDYETTESLVTFSKGPRGCPGKHQAVAICKIALAMIVREFHLKVAPHPARPSQQCPKVAKMVEWSVNGISLALQRR